MAFRINGNGPQYEAQALYSKIGFEQEGVKKSALVVDGKGIDEYEIAKLLK